MPLRTSRATHSLRMEDGSHEPRFTSGGKRMSERRAAGIRGVDHIGITVPDIASASEFLERAFDAQVLYDLLPQPVTPGTLPHSDDQVRLGVRPGVKWIASRVLRIGEGPS